MQSFIFLGNHVALDFLNTLPNCDGSPLELIGGFDDLLRWLLASGMLEERAASVAERWRGAAGEAVVTEARHLRANMHTLASALAAGEPIEAATVEALNQMLAKRLVERQLVAVVDPQDDPAAVGTPSAVFRTRFQLATRIPFERPADLLAPVVGSAADLLITATPSRVRRCEGPECVLFFYDVSKNGARRWCSMATCGNRHKVARHYQRKRATS